MGLAAALPQSLRQDLQLHATGPDRDGAPGWVIQDPVRNRFFRIGWLEYECLLRWPGEPAAIARDIESTTPLAVDPEQVEDFGLFLDQHQLVLPNEQRRQRMNQVADEPGWRHWRWWLHHYLFIRVPLIRPQRFLEWLSRWLAPLFTPAALILLIAASVLGLILVSRQWEHFTHSVLESFTPSGMLGFALALVISKTLHELGHAVVATRLGVRVAHMGVAFLVLWPMLYTDTGESWRLRSSRQRLAISVAGICVEVGLAGLATLAWALLDDGPLRQAALYLATVGWVLSLALNASPFMRFDGYFILTDLADFPNLHERSGACARVWLRRRLLGLPEPWPEPLPSGTRRKLIVFAFMTWLYRAIVFIGIAWMVYALFFKVLGIILMVVEIAWFLARPVWSELSVWKKRWPQVRWRRRLLLGLVVAGMAAGLFMPWHFDVTAHGVAHAQRQQLIFAPFPAQLDQLHPPGEALDGAVLASFTTPELKLQKEQTLRSIEALKQQLTGLLGQPDGLNQQAAITQQLNEKLAQDQGVLQELQRLTIRAGFTGQWVDVSPEVQPGIWLGVQEPLGILIDPESWVVDTYVEQRRIEHIELGAQARFLAQGQLKTLAAQVIQIDSTRTRSLAHQMMDSRFGGGFNTLPDTDKSIPAQALYRVRLQLLDAPAQTRELRGTMRIEGKARSLAGQALKNGLAKLIQESGF